MLSLMGQSQVQEKRICPVGRSPPVGVESPFGLLLVSVALGQVMIGDFVLG
jgi:hypothetical protein